MNPLDPNAPLSFLSLSAPAVTELFIERSRFIGYGWPVESLEDTQAHLAALRQEHPEATHIVPAWIIGPGGLLMRANDDGEPSGTAGRPMLEVLLGEGIRNVAVVVTRYFGGVLLGTGGLVRAYTQAVKEGLNNCKKGVMCFGTRMSIKASYTDIGKIQYILGQENIPIENSLYTEDVEFTILFKETMEKELIKKITEGTNARAKISVIERLYFVDKEKSD